MSKNDIDPIDLSKKLLPYENKWVALSLDLCEVLSTGKNLREAQKRAEKSGEKYIFLKVPPFTGSYVPTS